MTLSTESLPAFSDHCTAKVSFVGWPRHCRTRIQFPVRLSTRGACNNRVCRRQGKMLRLSRLYEAIAGEGEGRPTVLKTGEVVRKAPAQPQRWRTEPDLQAYGSSRLEGIGGRPQKTLQVDGREMTARGPNSDVHERKRDSAEE